MKMAAISSAVLLTSVLLLACGGPGDPKGNVKKALDQANIPNVAVALDDETKIVHLTGTVSSMSDRTRAEEIAVAAVGTTGRVLNDLTVEGLEAKVSNDPDARLLDALDRLLDNDPVLRERDVNFEVADGVVTVKGEVRTAAEKSRVSAIVKAAPGVKDFANALEIRPEY